MTGLSNPSLILLFLLVSLSNNYVLSFLGSLQVPSAVSLLGRGISCFVCSVVGAFFLKEQLVPRSLRPQIGRFVFAGIGLLAIVESYRSAKASEIALISRLDVPVIVIFGSLVSLKTSLSQKAVAILVIGFIFGSIVEFSDEQTSLMGLSLAALGTLLLAASYLLLSYTSKEESASVVTLTPAVSCIVFGGAILISRNRLPDFRWDVTFLTSVSGFFMYLSYRAVRHLYRRTHFFGAQFFYVLIPLISIPIDLLAYKATFRPMEYAAFAVGSLGVLILCQMTPKNSVSS